MTLAEVAQYLSFTRATIWRWARDGAIPAFTIRGEWRVSRSELGDWLRTKRYKTPGGRNAATSE